MDNSSMLLSSTNCSDVVILQHARHHSVPARLCQCGAVLTALRPRRHDVTILLTHPLGRAEVGIRSAAAEQNREGTVIETIRGIFSKWVTRGVGRSGRGL